ncbi:MAG: class I SAM-dependent methyltransferase [Bacteroidetes bacterium]|nr:class I SAM-dependent methyltransferase [Bacteroidota bacterium]
MSAFERLGIRSGNIPRTGKRYSDEQDQTKSTFGFKWSKRETYESQASKENTRHWLLEKYCGGDPEVVSSWLAANGERKIILDAGCGSGYSSLLLFGDHLKNHDYIGVDISEAVEVGRERFKEAGIEADFLQCDLGTIPIPDESVDIIFSEGVLHHTDDTERSIGSLALKLKKGGIFLFYVYAKKGVIREFTDDHIREYLQPLSNEEAWEALKPLTELGISLGKLNIEIDVKEDVPFLGIRKGKLDLQRFFYWNICKSYYRPEFTFDEMHHINFDWFRPLNCHRHTREEVVSFCENAGLEIERLKVEEAGITVVSRKE